MIENTTNRKETSRYDHIAYPGRAYSETHPDHLATLATLLGMTPPRVQECRVLEIGCGDGSNLIPLALSLPHSEFLGIDLAQQPIQRAQTVIQHTSLKNVTVHALDLLDFPAQFGTFDYIIAHGFYSWVPARLQQKLLQVCAEHLTPQGIAFISYNTYPAGHFRRALRDIMLFHLQTIGVQENPVHQAQSGARLVLDLMEGSSAWKTLLQEELSRTSKRPEGVVFHDELSPNYTPVYFTEFVQSAADHHLQFLSEASVRDLLVPPLKPEAMEQLKALAGSDETAFHQYVD
jgi:SAM-dependent methyltransferase